jgi:gluconate 5-dehydrogenase
MSSLSAFSLAGKTALVAGASRGIGLAVARALAAAGAHTILASRNHEKLEQEAAALNGEGFSAEARRLDVADPESVAEVGHELAERADVLVNVAGINIRKRFTDYTREEYQRLLRTNLDGLFELTQLVIGGMDRRGQGGKVVFIGSLMSVAGLPYLTVYAITKSALAGLTRVLAAEYGPRNIQVNCLAPGFIITDLNRAMWQDPALLEWLKGVQATPHTGRPEDIANVAVFLSSPASDYVTGQVIAVDGGYTTTARWPFEP